MKLTRSASVSSMSSLNISLFKENIEDPVIKRLVPDPTNCANPNWSGFTTSKGIHKSLNASSLLETLQLRPPPPEIFQHIVHIRVTTLNIGEKQKMKSNCRTVTSCRIYTRIWPGSNLFLFLASPRYGNHSLQSKLKLFERWLTLTLN